MDVVKNTIAENMGHGAHSLARPEHSSTLKVTSQQKEGKAAVVTSYDIAFTLLKQPLQTLHSQHIAGSRQRRTERHLRQAWGTVRAQSHLREMRPWRLTCLRQCYQRDLLPDRPP